MRKRPSARRYSTARLIDAADVRLSGTISTIGISSGGLSGCVTRQRSSFLQRPKISVGGSPLDDELIKTSPPTACSIPASNFCLAVTSSWIASMTQSASWTASERKLARTSSRRPRSTMDSGARSSATRARVRRSISLDARSMVSGFRSKIATGHPADAHNAAHPTPISPAPMTATLRGIVTPSPLRRAHPRAGRARTTSVAPARDALPSPRASTSPSGRASCGRGSGRRPARRKDANR